MPGVRTVALAGAEAGSGLAAAFGVEDRVGVVASGEVAPGFRGFTLSLVVSQPSVVDRLVATAIERGATATKPVRKSFWGYGGVVRAADGTIWKVASSSKKDDGTSPGRVDGVVLLLGVEDVKASRRFYVDRGLTVAKGFGGRYVEFAPAETGLTLALLRRDALAKDAGVAPDGTGAHGIVLRGDAGTFTDPDGFAWEAAGPKPAGSPTASTRASPSGTTAA